MRKINGLNTFSIGKKLTIAIDIDGTVADCSKIDFRQVNRRPDEFLRAEPIKGSLGAVKRLYETRGRFRFYYPIVLSCV